MSDITLRGPVAAEFFFNPAAEKGRAFFPIVSETKWFSPEEIYAMDGKTLRDVDIKDEVRDYLAGKRYPLEMVTHTVQE